MRWRADFGGLLRRIRPSMRGVLLLGGLGSGLDVVSTYHGRSGELNVMVPSVAEAPDIDGILDDAVWANAALLTGFV